MRHAVWDPAYSQEGIDSALTHNGLSYSVLSEDLLVEVVTTLIATNKVVGWFQGRAEVGPWVLGARRLLGTPQDTGAMFLLNPPTWEA